MEKELLISQDKTAESDELPPLADSTTGSRVEASSTEAKTGTDHVVAETAAPSFEAQNGGSKPPGAQDQTDEELTVGVYQAIAKLEVIQHQLRRLYEDFDIKLKYDAHKEKIIDHLHEELQVYKNDLFSRNQQALVVDVIKIIDDLRKLAAHYRSIEPDQRDREKLLEHLEQVPFDLEDIFLLRGITPFTESCRTVDPLRQRITKKVTTSDPSLDKLVAASLRPGYESDGRIIRPELVAVYVYEPGGGEGEAQSIND